MAADRHILLLNSSSVRGFGEKGAGQSRRLRLFDGGGGGGGGGGCGARSTAEVVHADCGGGHLLQELSSQLALGRIPRAGGRGHGRVKVACGTKIKRAAVQPKSHETEAKRCQLDATGAVRQALETHQEDDTVNSRRSGGGGPAAQGHAVRIPHVQVLHFGGKFVRFLDLRAVGAVESAEDASAGPRATAVHAVQYVVSGASPARRAGDVADHKRHAALCPAAGSLGQRSVCIAGRVFFVFFGEGRQAQAAVARCSPPRSAPCLSGF